MSENIVENVNEEIVEQPVVAPKKSKNKVEEQPLKKTYTIKIPIKELNPKDKVVEVGVNGKVYQILRGETVEVNETVYQILTESEII